IELVRVENKPFARADMERVPEVEHVIRRAAIDIDDARMALGAIADEPSFRSRVEIDGKREAAVYIGLAIDDPHLSMKLSQLGVGMARLPVTEADLGEPRAGAHQDREGA